MSRRAMLVFLAATAAVAFLISGCASGPQKAKNPEDAVTRLLQLRMDGETDPKMYRLYLPDDALASALASDSIAKKGKPPTPEWGDPTVYNETSATADVKIIWERSKVLTDWPEATVFKVVFDKGAWLVADAADVAKDYVPKKDPLGSTPATGAPPAAKPATKTP